MDAFGFFKQLWRFEPFDPHDDARVFYDGAYQDFIPAHHYHWAGTSYTEICSADSSAATTTTTSTTNGDKEQEEDLEEVRVVADVKDDSTTKADSCTYVAYKKPPLDVLGYAFVDPPIPADMSTDYLLRTLRTDNCACQEDVFYQCLLPNVIDLYDSDDLEYFVSQHDVAGVIFFNLHGRPLFSSSMLSTSKREVNGEASRHFDDGMIPLAKVNCAAKKATRSLCQEVVVGDIDRPAALHFFRRGKSVSDPDEYKEISALAGIKWKNAIINQNLRQQQHQDGALSSKLVHVLSTPLINNVNDNKDNREPPAPSLMDDMRWMEQCLWRKHGAKALSSPCLNFNEGIRESWWFLPIPPSEWPMAVSWRDDVDYLISEGRRSYIRWKCFTLGLPLGLLFVFLVMKLRRARKKQRDDHCPEVESLLEPKTPQQEVDQRRKERRQAAEREQLLFCIICFIFAMANVLTGGFAVSLALGPMVAVGLICVLIKMCRKADVSYSGSCNSCGSCFLFCSCIQPKDTRDRVAGTNLTTATTQIDGEPSQCVA